MHEDRERLTPATELQEVDPYHDPNDPESDLMRWRSEWEAQEWAYEQAYEHTDVDPIWQYFGRDEFEEIGREFVMEGPNCAEEWINEHINESIEIITEEQLETWVDGQMRLFAGYDVAQNGDTLEEGDYSTYQDLRTAWKLGIRDRLEGNSEYESLPDGKL